MISLMMLTEIFFPLSTWTIIATKCFRATRIPIRTRSGLTNWWRSTDKALPMMKLVILSAITMEAVIRSLGTAESLQQQPKEALLYRINTARTDWEHKKLLAVRFTITITPTICLFVRLGEPITWISSHLCLKEHSTHINIRLTEVPCHSPPRAV